MTTTDLFGWILAGIAVPTCLANGLLIYVLCSHKRLWTVTNQIIVSMAASDLAVGLITLPLRVMTTFSPEMMQYQAICLIIHIASFFFSAASLYHLLAIAVERFCAIVYPLRYKTIFTPRTLRACIFAAWTFPVIYSVAPFFNQWSPESESHVTEITSDNTTLSNTAFFSRLSTNGTKRENSEVGVGTTVLTPGGNNIYLLNTTLEQNESRTDCKYGRTVPCPVQSVMYLSIIIIFLVMVLLCLKIFWAALRQIRKINTAQPSASWAASTFQEVRAFVVSAVAVVWFFVTYSPLLARFVGICFLGQPNTVNWQTVLALGLVYFNSTINPFIYGLLSRDIRTGIFQQLCTGRICHVDTPDTDNPGLP